MPAASQPAAAPRGPSPPRCLRLLHPVPSATGGGAAGRGPRFWRGGLEGGGQAQGPSGLRTSQLCPLLGPGSGPETRSAGRGVRGRGRPRPQGRGSPHALSTVPPPGPPRSPGSQPVGRTERTRAQRGFQKETASGTLRTAGAVGLPGRASLPATLLAMGAGGAAEAPHHPAAAAPPSAARTLAGGTSVTAAGVVAPWPLQPSHALPHLHSSVPCGRSPRTSPILTRSRGPG